MADESPITAFIDRHYRHFNAATVREAAKAYARHLESGGQMMLALAGAMSTAELGISLAEMIRRDKVHAIACTGANLEEDIFNLVAHDLYVRVPGWRNLTPQQEKELEAKGLNRVTDTCIPVETAFRAIEAPMLDLWKRADANGERFFPHEFVYQLVQEGLIRDQHQINPADSWIIAAAEKNLPMFVPGWEDSTLGNIFAAHVITGEISGHHVVRSGTEYMDALAEWYLQTTTGRSIRAAAPMRAGSPTGEVVRADPLSPENALRTVGFFQIGGGIAGDFPICVVPMIQQDLRCACPYWSYFCQISDSTTSYGSYSGAIPTEKISWGKLDIDTPKFIIESDATIVAPLIFAYVLGW